MNKFQNWFTEFLLKCKRRKARRYEAKVATLRCRMIESLAVGTLEGEWKFRLDDWGRPTMWYRAERAFVNNERCNVEIIRDWDACVARYICVFSSVIGDDHTLKRVVVSFFTLSGAVAAALFFLENPTSVLKTRH